MEERRRDRRVPLILEVQVESLSGKHPARISDISIGGCYIESIGYVAIGERVRFEMQLPTGRWLSLSGEVVTHQPNLGFGVRFTDLSDLERSVLTNIIEYMCG